MLPGATEPFNRVSFFQIARSMVSRSYLLALLMVVLSCNKKPDVQEDGYVYISGSGLGGKWLAKEKYVSAGGGPIPVNLPREQWFTMEFKSDSSFTYSANFPKTDSLFSQYSLSGFYINVTSTVNTKRDSWIYEFMPDGNLDLSLFRCFEGCSYRLRRIR